MGDLAMEEDRPFTLPSFAAPLRNPDPNSIRAETWVVVEDPALEVLNSIHPTLDSEEKRKDVIEYVQKLIRCSLGLEVFPYGSVPLKTYLPDGDIDLTVFSTPNAEKTLPRDVLAVLQAEEKNGNNEFELKDIQFIDAEVKLIKCLVEDIVIDISFNQLGGLCTLCFLEQVDRLVGKDHLFKRSILMIKAWCFYESRILGAHHGLLSTYALETLVLFIFHVFNPSLHGPIGVLYKFLDYYSKFDWDNCCISLDGPVCKYSLPNLVVKSRENEGSDVLLSGEFLRNCTDMFMVPSKELETNVRAFPLKYLNIIDPLKQNNNLGRSVHKGSYYRIQSAFKLGARKLGQILQEPSHKIGNEIKKFFKNTLQRHKPKFGPNPTLTFGVKGHFIDNNMYPKFSNGDFDDYIYDSNGDFDKSDSSTKSSQLGQSNVEKGSSIHLSSNSNGDNCSVGESENSNLFLDLIGDYDGHIRSLFYGQCCLGYALSGAVVHAGPPTSPYGHSHPLQPVVHPWFLPFEPNLARSRASFNGVWTNGTPADAAFYWGERCDARGNGPYFPVMQNCSTGNDRQPTMVTRRNRIAPMANDRLQPACGGSAETSSVLEPNHEPRPSLLNQTHQQQPVQVNSTPNSRRTLEFGSFVYVTDDTSNAVASKLAPSNSKQEREKSFYLKNEDEFPPLSA